MFGLLLGAASLVAGARKDKKDRDERKDSQKHANAQNALNRRDQLAFNKRQEYLNSPKGIVAESKKAGVNPLWMLGGAGAYGGGQAPNGGFVPLQGAGVSRTSLALMDLSQSFFQKEAQKTELLHQNQQLQKRLEAQTIRPNVGGIYSRAANMPTASQPKEDEYGKLSYEARVVGSKWVNVPVREGLSHRKLYLNGREFKTNPMTSPAADWEHMYGEIAAETVGATAYAKAGGVHARGSKVGEALAKDIEHITYDRTFVIHPTESLTIKAPRQKSKMPKPIFGYSVNTTPKKKKTLPDLDYYSLIRSAGHHH